MNDGLFDDGGGVRRLVLGDAHVDRSLNTVDPRFAPLQRLVTEYCWGAVWTRSGLDRRTRSLLTLAILTALGRAEEVELHTGDAIRNGCSEDEIVEVLLQAAVYCGVPAALTAMRAVRTALATPTR